MHHYFGLSPITSVFVIQRTRYHRTNQRNHEGSDTHKNLSEGAHWHKDKDHCSDSSRDTNGFQKDPFCHDRRGLAEPSSYMKVQANSW